MRLRLRVTHALHISLAEFLEQWGGEGRRLQILALLSIRVRVQNRDSPLGHAGITFPSAFEKPVRR